MPVMFKRLWLGIAVIAAASAALLLSDLGSRNGAARKTSGAKIAIVKLVSNSLLDEIEQGLLAVVPTRYLRRAHHWLILHGRYVCTARNPKCQGCLIADLCEHRKESGKPSQPGTA